MNNIKENYLKIYGKSYFSKRLGNDDKRQKSFAMEKKLVNKYVSSGKILDIGCSTGEFLKFMDWDGEMYGMGISDHAIKEAKKNKIKFNKDIWTKNFFDVIVYRGTIQHIDTPFLYLQKSYDALKPGGKLIFLATPNINSTYFKFWNTLPALDVPETTFFVPHDKWFIQSLKNIGFNFLEIEYPYVNSPYSNLFMNHFHFLLKLFGFNFKFPFWGNMMNIVLEKNITGFVGDSK